MLGRASCWATGVRYTAADDHDDDAYMDDDGL
jgi:hypothetical protein